jgi:hypothetical protein
MGDRRISGMMIMKKEPICEARMRAAIPAVQAAPETKRKTTIAADFLPMAMKIQISHHTTPMPKISHAIPNM